MGKTLSEMKAMVGVIKENNLFPVKGQWHASLYILIHLFKSLCTKLKGKDGGKEEGKEEKRERERGKERGHGNVKTYQRSI